MEADNFRESLIRMRKAGRDCEQRLDEYLARKDKKSLDAFLKSALECREAIDKVRI